MGSRQWDAASCLARQPLFQGLAPQGLARLADACELRQLSRGGEVFQAGQICEGLYVVLDGRVKLYARSAQGHEKVIEVVGEGGCVAEALMFSDDIHGVHARALSDTRILLVPRQALLQEIEHNPGLAVRLLKGVARQLNGLLRDIEAVTLHSGVQRVVAYLLRASNSAGLPAAEEPEVAPKDVTVSLPASKGTIASLLSVTPEHFSRILHDLQARGLIAVQRRQIHILDAQALARFA
jgi:CRP-like cAMP-binding protein